MSGGDVTPTPGVGGSNASEFVSERDGDMSTGRQLILLF